MLTTSNSNGYTKMRPILFRDSGKIYRIINIKFISVTGDKYPSLVNSKRRTSYPLDYKSCNIPILTSEHK